VTVVAALGAATILTSHSQFSLATFRFLRCPAVQLSASLEQHADVHVLREPAHLSFTEKQQPPSQFFVSPRT
jgi:hypothetical protein